MDWWFDGWSGVVRVLAVGTAAYAGLVLLLRISGKRTLGKFNAFDFVVTVALGSTLATILLSRTVPLAEGLAALGLLAGLQYAVAWLSVRSARVRRAVKSEPALLLHDGVFLEDAMRRERVSRDEVESALRAAGVGDAREADAVLLETNGNLSVLVRVDRAAQAPTLPERPDRGRAPRSP
jgi:uncharacterized membrane protein YcaP (DUF421 family)